jgi:hypothetical protein
MLLWQKRLKTAVEADPTDVRYLAPAFNKTTLTGYTLCLGSDSDPDGNPETSDARTCPSGLWSSMRAGGITDNKTFGIWGGDCGYVKFATPLTVTTGSRLDISLTIACSGAFSNKVPSTPSIREEIGEIDRLSGVSLLPVSLLA